MKYDRKGFLKISGSAFMGLTLVSCSSSGKNSGNLTKITNPGLQLYSLRDDLPKDPKGILKQVAGFGYKEIESYEGQQGMFWGMGNKGFKNYMDQLGMKIVSSHCNVNADFERKAAEAAEIGMSYLISPYLGRQKSLDDYKKAAENFNKKGEICKKNGIRFAYHNHNYSFIEQDGQFPQDVMMQHSNPALVDFEMDIYWVVDAHQDPIAWLKKYNGRFKLCHVKDRKKGAIDNSSENQSCIVGTGTINFSKILTEAKKLGMQHYIVEQEAYEKAPIECVKESVAYLKQISI